jgi:hypothetical protein
MGEPPGYMKQIDSRTETCSNCRFRDPKRKIRFACVKFEVWVSYDHYCTDWQPVPSDEKRKTRG